MIETMTVLMNRIFRINLKLINFRLSVIVNSFHDINCFTIGEGINPFVTSITLLRGSQFIHAKLITMYVVPRKHFFVVN